MTGIAARLLAVSAATALVGLAVSAAQAECSSPVPDTALLEPGKVIVSINPVSPPLQYVDEEGNLLGIRVEVGDEIIRRLCLEPEHIRVDDFNIMIPGLQGGRWDIINTGVFYTEERAKKIYMVRNEYQGISVSTRPEDKGTIKSVDDLSGMKVGVDIGGYEENKLKLLSDELVAKGLDPIDYQIFQDTNIDYQALRAGQVDAVFTIDGVSKTYEDRGISAINLRGLYPQATAIAFSDKELAQAFADTLTQMREDGWYDEIYDRYGVTKWDGPFEVVGPDM